MQWEVTAMYTGKHERLYMHPSQLKMLAKLEVDFCEIVDALRSAPGIRRYDFDVEKSREMAKSKYHSDDMESEASKFYNDAYDDEDDRYYE